MTPGPETTQRPVTRQLARRLTSIVQNRFELLCLEMREERERVERAVFLVSGAVLSLLLAGGTVTILAAIVLEDAARIWVLGGLAVLFALTAGVCLTGLGRLRRDWNTLEETRRQLRLDREAIERLLQ